MSSVCFAGEVRVRAAVGRDLPALAQLGCPAGEPALVAADGLGTVLGAAVITADGAPYVVVDAAERGRGLGTALLVELWVTARDGGQVPLRARLDADARPARALARAAGFAERPDGRSVLVER